MGRVRRVLAAAAAVAGVSVLPTVGDVQAAPGHHIDIRVACPVDHPKMVALVEATKAYIEANASDMDQALSWRQDPEAVATYPDDFSKAFTEPQPHTPRSTTKGRWVPLGPIPNDFGYPDGYWHWVDWTNPPVDDTWEGIVRPDDPQYLLLVQADEYPQQGRNRPPEDPGARIENEARGWVVEGVMFAKDDAEEGPPFFTHVLDGETYECNPFHNHGDAVPNPHFHLWPWHHVHPFAMNPPHTCKGGTGDSRQSPYPLRSGDDPASIVAGSAGWGCLYDTAEEDDHMGFEDPGVPEGDGPSAGQP
jgi:hypothetical protein